MSYLGGRKISDDSDAGDLGPVTSILSFVEAGAGDTRRQSLIHGLDSEDVGAERRGSGAGATGAAGCRGRLASGFGLGV